MRWAALFICGFALLAGSALAQQLLSPSEFRDNEIARINAAHPTARVDVVDELSFKITVPDDPDVSNFQGFLDNAYHDYQNDPSRIDAILDGWTSAIFDRSDQVHTRERLVSIIRSHGRIQSTEQMLANAEKPGHLIVRTFAGDLDEALAFDSENAVGYATDLDLQDLALTPDEAWALAHQNLPTRMGPVEIEPSSAMRGLLIVGGGNGLAPSNLLDPNFCSGPYGRNMIFVADRYSYVMADRTPGTFQVLRTLATQMFQGGDSESAVVLVCQGGHLVAESD